MMTSSSQKAFPCRGVLEPWTAQGPQEPESEEGDGGRAQIDGILYRVERVIGKEVPHQERDNTPEKVFYLHKKGHE